MDLNHDLPLVPLDFPFNESMEEYVNIMQQPLMDHSFPMTAENCPIDQSVVTTVATVNTDFPNTKLVAHSDTKPVFKELCPICGDEVSGYHYGLLTCESCKGFFKRTVQNKKVYTCIADRNCHIDKTQRKRCPFCRFQKCLEVGMKLEAVRPDRTRGGRSKFGPMYKRDRARKLQMIRQKQAAVQTINHAYDMVSGSASSPSPFHTVGLPEPLSSITIKQEIQIPQVSSVTSSPDASPCPSATSFDHQGANYSMISTDAFVSPTDSQQQQPTSDLQIVSVATHESDKATCTEPASPLPASSNTQFEENENLILDNEVSPLIIDSVQGMDDRDWKSSLFSLLQRQTHNQCEVDLFELMCKVLDQNVFNQVDWARNSFLFKELNVDDQMKLLQNSWADMLVLDHVHHTLHNSLPDEVVLHNGQKFDLLSLGVLGVSAQQDRFIQVTNILRDLKFDLSDYTWLKFLLLLNPDVRGLMNKKYVQNGHERVQQALQHYCLTSYPQIEDRFNKLMSVMPNIYEIASTGEEYLYQEHCTGRAPTQTLLMEMMIAKRK